MLELKIKTYCLPINEVRRVMEYVAGMIEIGITSGILRDTKGNEICEWGKV